MKLTLLVLTTLSLAAKLQAAAPILLPVQEDTWIDGLNSSSIRGTDQRLGICPLAMYWIYLKFDLTSVNGVVTGAELRMRRVDGSRPEEISFYHISDDSWSETTLNGPNRPAPTDPSPSEALGGGEALAEYDRWTSDALRDTVQLELAGDGILSLMLREDPGAAFDVRHYFSKEAPRDDVQKPHLVLTVAESETVAPEWIVADIGPGTKPAFDFDASGRIHVMGMTEELDGEVWYAAADHLEGPWEPERVAEGYFYGPGDLRCDSAGTAHLAWHNHDLENADHLEIAMDGVQRRFDIQTPGLHDGWDNSLAIDSLGQLHMASVFPSAFGGQHSLQYGSFDGLAWTFQSMITNSGSFMYGLNTSVAVDSRGDVHVVYCETSGFTSPGDLKYALRRNGEWSFSTIVSNGVKGRFPSLALDHWDRPNVAWLDLEQADPTHGTVRYGVLNDSQWDIDDVDILEHIEVGFSGARKSVSLVLDEGWRPHLAYSDRRRIVYAIKPFDVWEITNVVEHVEATYNGLVVLRLNGEDEPAIVFWQPAAELFGQVRLAGLRDPNIWLFNPKVDVQAETVTLGWTSGPEDTRYVIEKRTSLAEGVWADVSGPTPLEARTFTDETPGDEAIYRVRGIP